MHNQVRIPGALVYAHKESRLKFDYAVVARQHQTLVAYKTNPQQCFSLSTYNVKKMLL